MSSPLTVLAALRWSAVLGTCLGCASGAPDRLDAGPAPDAAPFDASTPPDAAAGRDTGAGPMVDDDAGSDEAADARAQDAGDNDGGALTKPDPSCGNLMLQHAGHYYYVCPSLQTWGNARAACRANPVFDLIRIDDAAEQSFLETSVTSLTDDVWLNATDTTTQDSWAWMDDGTVFWTGDSAGAAVAGLYNDWSTGEPSGGGDCARHTLEDAAWRDSNCDQETHFFVCEAAPP